MADVLPFPERSKADVHFAGYLLGRIRHLVGEANDPREAITIEPVATSHVVGIHVAKVRIQGDPTEYEMTLRPAPRGAA